jgi:hypothetical protein
MHIPNRKTGIHGTIEESLKLELVSMYIIIVYVTKINTVDPINKYPLFLILSAKKPRGTTKTELATYGNIK